LKKDRWPLAGNHRFFQLAEAPLLSMATASELFGIELDVLVLADQIKTRELARGPAMFAAVSRALS
jgi:hypothetical protein